MVGIIGDCDQNGDRESKSDEICHICIIASVKVKYEKYGTLSMYLLSVQIPQKQIVIYFAYLLLVTLQPFNGLVER